MENEPIRLATVGTLDWATRTGGRLSFRDRVQLVARGLLIESRSWPDRFLRRLDVGRDRLAKIDLDQLRIPDSLACRDAERLCAEQTPPSGHGGAVLERYPRLDLKDYFPAVFEKEAALVPGSRTLG